MELSETYTQDQGKGSKCSAKPIKSVLKGVQNGQQVNRSSILKCLELGEGPGIKRSSIFKNMEVAESELNDDYAKFENMGKESRSCAVCNGFESANRCNECDQFLCSACFVNHTYKKSIPLQALSTSEDCKEGFQTCTQHEGKELSNLCVTCDVELCNECITPTHTDHELKELSELVQGLRQMLQSGLEKFSSYHKKSEEAQAKLASRALQIFGQEAIDCIEQLKTERLKLVQSVYLREIQLRKEILAKAMAKKMEILEKQNLVKSIDGQVGGYLDAIPQLLTSNDNHLLQHRKTLLQQCAQLEKATDEFLDQESFNHFVESGFSLQISLESFPEISKSMKSQGCLSYTNGNLQDNPVPTGSQEPGPLQRVLQDLQEEMSRTVSCKVIKCPATERSPIEVAARPKSNVESNETAIAENVTNHNEQQMNIIPLTSTFHDEDMETSPIDLNGELNTEKDDSVQAEDMDEGEVEKYEYSGIPFDDDDDGSSHDSDYDPILQTARNESQPRRQSRRVSTDTLNSAGGGQASYDSDSDYSAVAVADKIKEWTKRSTDELKSEQAKAESKEDTKEQISSKVSAPKTGKKQKVEKQKNGPKVPVTPRVSRSRPHEISPNYQGRAQRNSRGRVPKNLEGFAIDLPGRSPEKAKPTSTTVESPKKGRRRLHPNEEQPAKEEPSSKKPKAEPTRRVSTRRTSAIPTTEPETSSGAADLKTDIEPNPPKVKGRRGRKSKTDDSVKPSPSPKATKKETPTPKSGKISTSPQISKRTRAAKGATLLNTQVEKSTDPVPRTTQTVIVVNSEKPYVPTKMPAKTTNRTTVPKATKAAKATKPAKDPAKPPVKDTVALEPKRGARAKPKIRIDQNNGVTTELDYPLTPTATDKMKITFDDSNEDYCTVCLDGGGVLICCDVCPKVFHGNCHLPAIKGVPEDDWQCLFCTNKDELGSLTEKDSARTKYIIFPEDKTISDLDFIYLCKFISELFKCKESLVVRGLFEKLLQMNNEEEPVHLNYIRSRVTLQTPEPFANIQEIIFIIRKMFGQAKEYYPEDTECGKRARIFEKSFNDLLASYYPGLEETSQ